MITSETRDELRVLRLEIIDNDNKINSVIAGNPEAWQLKKAIKQWKKNRKQYERRLKRIEKRIRKY